MALCARAVAPAENSRLLSQTLQATCSQYVNFGIAARDLSSWPVHGRLVGVLALCACATSAADDHSDAADMMAKVLAGVAFVKELGNFQNAQHAMNIFGTVADAHISEARPAAPLTPASKHWTAPLYCSPAAPALSDACIWVSFISFFF